MEEDSFEDIYPPDMEFGLVHSQLVDLVSESVNLRFLDLFS